MRKAFILLFALMIIALYASCSGTPKSEQTDTLPTESAAPIYDPGKVYYTITDYYNEDGSFSNLGLALEAVNSEKTLVLRGGDIFIIGDRQYRVTVESLTLSFYTQSSLADVDPVVD